MKDKRQPDEIDFFTQQGVFWDHTGDKDNPYLFLDERSPLPSSFKDALQVAGLAIIRFPLSKLGRRKPPRVG